jgi:hypothetical protein
MRIEVLVPGIRKERGKLPAPTALGALKLAVPLAAGPPTCSELIGPVLPEPVNAAEVGLPVATEHPVNPRNDQERGHQSAPVRRQWRAADVIRFQTAARCSVPVDCVA